jgi:serine phosphatase RsbU (regulator of sigma subunit)
VTEAEDADRRLYGVKRLEKMLVSLPVGEAQRLVAAVIDDLRRFIGEAEQADDITLMALRRVAGPVRLQCGSGLSYRNHHTSV